MSGMGGGSEVGGCFKREKNPFPWSPILQKKSSELSTKLCMDRDSLPASLYRTRHHFKRFEVNKWRKTGTEQQGNRFLILFKKLSLEKKYY